MPEEAGRSQHVLQVVPDALGGVAHADVAAQVQQGVIDANIGAKQQQVGARFQAGGVKPERGHEARELLGHVGTGPRLEGAQDLA